MPASRRATDGAGRNFLLKLGPAHFLEEIAPGPGLLLFEPPGLLRRLDSGYLHDGGSGMRLLKAIGLVTFGVLLGVGATGTSARTQVQERRLTLAGSSVEWAGDYPFRFVKDNQTGACFLVSLSRNEPGSRAPQNVTAMTRVDGGACLQ